VAQATLGCPPACWCGASIYEDLQLAADAHLYAPGLAIRQWRCLNGHSATRNPYAAQRQRAFEFVCDVCAQAGQALDPGAKRHAACWPEHNRRRMQKYWDRQRALTSAQKISLNGTRR
jgi:hypothetical protein